MYLNNNVIKHTEEKQNSKGSKFVNIMITLYMISVLLFTSYLSLIVISQTIFVIAFGSCAIYMFFKGKSFRLDAFICIFITFITFCFITFLWTYDINKSITNVITLVQLLIMSIILYSYISAYENIGSFILGLMISGFVCAYVVVGYYGFTEYIELMLQGYRLGGPIANVNVIGLYMAVTVTVTFYYAYFRGKKICYALMIFPLIVALGTGSRKTIAMIALCIATLIFLKYRESVSINSFVKLLIAAFVFILILNKMSTMELFSGVFGRIAKMFGEESGTADSSTIVRMSMIEAGWEYFMEHPYTGIGVGNSSYITKEAIGMDTYLHNNFVEILATVGVFGFLIYYSIYFYLIKNLYVIFIKTNDVISTLMLAIMVSLLVMDFGMVSYYSKMTYIYFTIAATAVTIGKRKVQRLEEEMEKQFEEQEYADGIEQKV